jgi:tRNA-Thr(GGU) m(6)t(6)A37 methyltransferase TsaA
MSEKIDSSAGFHMSAIGKVHREEGRTLLRLDERYRDALVGLDQFSHAGVLWWFDRFDDPASRATLQVDPPFPAPTLGVFALKAPTRPNPIGLSVVRVASVDVSAAIVEVYNMDAYDGTPLLDIKPYLPSFDRVERPRVPEWAAAWPSAMPENGIPLDRMPDE